MTGDYDLGYIEPLTERETEVLQMLADGASNKDIATAMVIEVSTVKSHNNQIYSKLQVKNRQQAVFRARTLGLLSTDVTAPLQQPHNLPADIMPFIGRRQEIDDILRLFSDDTIRFITILGPGGMGKTRLAIEIGHRLLGHFMDGVYFVPLASVNSVEKLTTSIADAIGLTFHGEVHPKQQLLDALQKQQLLLIIDNFEQLLAHRELLKDVLNAASKVELLVTSREKLGLVGEVAYVVDGLSLRTNSDDDTDMDDAVQLFIEAARRTSSSIDPSDMPFVTSICQLLGRMPLAILLGAGWLDSLTLAQIEQEIRGGLSILDAPQSSLTHRHENIETVFD
ncbi:AAA family ATPase, partial [Candidatus Saccharibacteria bacterium]|nr:AAA family ATPase [Candidatus Saccharibacteria bacterium]